ncbi:hypothetical protein AB0C02_26220 [Micromonospora sp. NPDC048999]
MGDLAAFGGDSSVTGGVGTRSLSATVTGASDDTTATASAIR